MKQLLDMRRNSHKQIAAKLEYDKWWLLLTDEEIDICIELLTRKNDNYKRYK